MTEEEFEQAVESAGRFNKRYEGWAVQSIVAELFARIEALERAEKVRATQEKILGRHRAAFEALVDK